MDRFPHIVFAGGGTAGHLFPGLAVAERVRAATPQARVTFVGSGRPFERSHVAAAGFEYVAHPCRPLPRSAGETIRFVADNLTGYFAARWFLRQERAAVVVGLGGYVSVATARAAIRLRIPLALLEQNAMPGRATRWLARRAERIFLGWDEACRHLPRRRLETPGNPIRNRFAKVGRSSLAAAARPRLLILGGSGGSRSLNRIVPLAIYKVGPALAGWEILHQTGAQQTESTAELYRKLGLTARVAPFIDNMPETLAATELAISRAGGSTLAELAAMGVASILLPWPRAADDHQLRNAQIFSNAGACRLVDERDTATRPDHRLAAELATLAGDPAARRQMCAAARRLARLDAAERIAAGVLELAGPIKAAPRNQAA